jgi:excisionase family DNA binding protein
MLTVKEAAQVLGLAPTSLYKLIENDSTFPVLQMGRRKGVPREELKQWIHEKSLRK